MAIYHKIIVLRKLVFFLLLLFIAFSLPKTCLAQEDTKVYKPWTFILEQGDKDVHYRVLECGGKTQVHLRVFNDAQREQEINFVAEIINSDGLKFEKDIKFKLAGATRLMTECISDNKYDHLKFDLPANYDPSSVIVKVHFKE